MGSKSVVVVDAGKLQFWENIQCEHWRYKIKRDADLEQSFKRSNKISQKAIGLC